MFSFSTKTCSRAQKTYQEPTPDVTTSGSLYYKLEFELTHLHPLDGSVKQSELLSGQCFIGNGKQVVGVWQVSNSGAIVVP